MSSVEDLEKRGYSLTRAANSRALWVSSIDPTKVPMI